MDRISKSKIEKIANQAVENLFFKIEEKEITLEEYNRTQPEGLLLQGGKGKSTVLAGNTKRNIFSEGNELAEKILTDNIIDFHDKRVNVTNQKQSAWKNQLNEDLVQIDLGEVRSLKESQILAEKVDFQNIPQGSEIIDKQTNKDTEFDLLLVGRKLNKEEQDEHKLTINKEGEESKHNIKHFINKEIFHEANMRNIDKGVKKDEGVWKYYLRGFAKVILLVSFISTLFLAHSFSNQLGTYYEDYVDYTLYQAFKRKNSVEYLTKITYRLNAYGSEN
mmetsp:Transcript_32722/g.28997  ORF Transcript_32722/g.28997 Transcript_32722/m.28997 type:complete len:277 (+) Transcript_32722:224-1054(+)